MQENKNQMGSIKKFNLNFKYTILISILFRYTFSLKKYTYFLKGIKKLDFMA